MKPEEDIILSIGNTELKITKEGKIQMRGKSGVASLEHKGIAETTTSTAWVSTSIALNEEQKSKLRKIAEYLNENKPLLIQIAQLLSSLK